MSTSKIGSLISVILFALLAAPAHAAQADRSPTPSGAAFHTGDLSAWREAAVEGRLAATLAVPPPASRAARASREDGLERGAECMLPDTAQRVRLPEPADVAAWRAAFALTEARDELRAVLEPVPGDLIGVASGNPRMSEGYWRRMGRLEQEVRDAQGDLDAAGAECHALG